MATVSGQTFTVGFHLMTTETPTKRTRAWLAGGIASAIVLVAVGAYVALTLLAPAPNARLNAEPSAENTFAIEEAPIAWPEKPAAISTLGNETIRTNGKDALTSMGSITKLIPVLVSLEYKPYDPADTAEYVLGPKDSAYLREVLLDDASTGPIAEGEGVTRYEMLQQIFLPSANNYVLAYRDWIFGDNETFVAETKKWFAKHDINSLIVEEPTGLRATQTKGTAEDLVKVAKIALSYPVIAEIAAQKEATIDGIGTIESANPLIDDPGVRGLKTGTIRDENGVENRNIIVVRDVTVADRTVTFIGVALGQPNVQARIDAGRALASSIDANIQEITVVTEGENVGTVTAWNGERIPLIATASASTVLTLDEQATRALELSPIAAGTKSGTEVGVLKITTPTGIKSVAVRIGESIPEPDAWWRLSHPFEVLGWK